MRDSRQILMVLRRAYSSSSNSSKNPEPRLSESQKAVRLTIPAREQSIELSFAEYVQEREKVAAREAAKKATNEGSMKEKIPELDESLTANLKRQRGLGFGWKQ